MSMATAGVMRIRTSYTNIPMDSFCIFTIFHIIINAIVLLNEQLFASVINWKESSFRHGLMRDSEKGNEKVTKEILLRLVPQSPRSCPCQCYAV